MRIPFVLQWPHMLRSDAATGVGLSSVDIAPTLLGLLGLGGKVPGEMQGRDVSGALLGSGGAVGKDSGTAAPSALYFYYPRNGDEPHVRGLRTGTAKFVARFHPREGLSTVLYDLARDPYELENIVDAAQVHTHAAALQAALADAAQHWPGETALAALAGAP